MAVVPGGEKVPGDRLAALTSSSGFAVDIVVKTMSVTSYEVKGQKGPFTVCAVMVMDANGDMIHLVENLFGQEAQRLNLSGQRSKFWMPNQSPAVFRLKELRKVTPSRTNQLSCSVMQTVVIEKFGTPHASLKTVPFMAGCLEDKVLPPYYLPRRQELGGLRHLTDPSFVTICGVLTSAGDVETTTKGAVRSISISDGETSLEGVKVWHENHRQDLTKVLKAREVMIVLQNYWIGFAEGGDMNKCVNVPDRSQLVVLRRQELTREDAEYFDRIKNAKPKNSICLKENIYLEGKNRKSMDDWAKETATQTSSLVLSALGKAVEGSEDEMFAVEGALVTVDTTADWNGKKGFFARVEVVDHTGQFACRSNAEPLLALLDLPMDAEDELQRLLKQGPTMFKRGRLFIHRQVKANPDDPATSQVSLILRAAAVSYFDTAPTNLMGLTAALYPCSLEDIKKPSFGYIQVNGVSVLRPLVLLEGGKFAPRTAIDQKQVASITNVSCQCLVSEGQTVDTVAKVPLEVQTQYVLETGQPALVVVAGRKRLTCL